MYYLNYTEELSTNKIYMIDGTIENEAELKKRTYIPHLPTHTCHK